MIESKAKGVIYNATYWPTRQETWRVITIETSYRKAFNSILPKTWIATTIATADALKTIIDIGTRQ